MPQEAGFGDIAALGAVDGVEMADAFAVLGILTVGDVHHAIHNHRVATSLRVLATPSLGVRIERPSCLLTAS
jgi:hypothetical protein